MIPLVFFLLVPVLIGCGIKAPPVPAYPEFSDLEESILPSSSPTPSPSTSPSIPLAPTPKTK